MRNYFTFDGVSSETYSTYIATSNMFDAPAEDVESIVIPGRNGAYHFSNNRFEAFTATLNVYVKDITHLDDLRNFLMSRKKPCVYMESLRGNEYRMARFKSAFVVGTSDRKGATLQLTFECQPERFLLSGETTVQFTSNGTITNPTFFDAKPLIRVYGEGSFMINSYSVTVSDVYGYTDIDFSTLNAYYDTENLNSHASFGELVLAPGENTIVLNGVDKIIITPRWNTR